MGRAVRRQIDQGDKNDEEAEYMDDQYRSFDLWKVAAKIGVEQDCN